MNETINGLHSCKPGNEPVVGQIKTFTVEQKPARNGKKAWIKIKSAGEKYGGTPFRILSATHTGFIDAHGNHGFNIEIESVLGNGAGENTKSVREAPAPPHIPVSEQHADAERMFPTEDGVKATREHLMQSVNLYNLCVDAVDKCVKPRIENMDGELYQAAIGTLFIEASHKRTNDGVNWWSYVDKMPTQPIKQ